MPNEISPDARAIVEAIQDLTRLTIMLNGQVESKADAIRRMSELSIPPVRIAAILAIEPKHVHSTLAKAKKKSSRMTSASVVGGGTPMEEAQDA